MKLSFLGRHPTSTVSGYEVCEAAIEQSFLLYISR